MNIVLDKEFRGYKGFIVKDYYYTQILDGSGRCSCAEKWNRKRDLKTGTDNCKHVKACKEIIENGK